MPDVRPLRIKEIKELLKKDNNIRFLDDVKYEDIDNVKSTKEYNFTCDNGHHFKNILRDVFVNGKFHCTKCGGRVVVEGETDILSTRPDFVPFLFDKEDAKRYTSKSGKVLKWQCPYCGNTFHASPHQMSYRRSKCDVCGRVRSVAELFITELFDQQFVLYEPQKSFIWSERKIYDFFLPEVDAIVEVHGCQHYYDEKQIEIDNYKRELAKGNITHYIELNASDTSNSGLKYMVMNSDLMILTGIYNDEVNWERCFLACSPKRMYEVCEAYNRGIKEIRELALMFGVSNPTIVYDLKQGRDLGMTDYDPDIARLNARRKKNKKRHSKPVLQYSLDGKFIKEYPSISEARRQTGAVCISDCLNGSRKKSGGYVWKAKYDRS